MPLKVDCDCGKSFKVSVTQIGEKTLCPYCQSLHLINLTCCERGLIKGEKYCSECGTDLDLLPFNIYSSILELQKHRLNGWIGILNQIEQLSS